MKAYILFCICIIMALAYAAEAEMVTFEEQYVYNAGEGDSKLTCRTISLLQVKRLLLERLGTYIESRTDVVDNKLTRDQITSLSAGIISTEIIDEKWNGTTYSLTAKIEADPDAISKAINALKESHDWKAKIERLEDINEKSMDKIEELKNELHRIQSDLITINRDYGSASQIIDAMDLFERGAKSAREGNYRESVEYLNNAIKIDPNYRHYFNRGMSYMRLRQYEHAISDFTTVISQTPDMKEAYFHRGQAFMKIGEREKGLKDIRKAAELGSGGAKRWLQLKGG